MPNDAHGCEVWKHNSNKYVHTKARVAGGQMVWASETVLPSREKWSKDSLQKDRQEKDILFCVTENHNPDIRYLSLFSFRKERTQPKFVVLVIVQQTGNLRFNHIRY